MEEQFRPKETVGGSSPSRGTSCDGEHPTIRHTGPTMRSLYLMDGTARHADLLAKLGPHTTTGYCIYFKKLSDLDPAVLEQLVKASFDYVTAKSADGPIREILWKARDY